MILYLDTSALVKRYVAEPGSLQVEALIAEAEAIGTVVVSRVEVAAALAKATRIGAVTRETAAKALRLFNDQWETLLRLQVGEPLAARAAALAWEHGLRGYDAVQLAAALLWRESLGETIFMATYDRDLWRAARASGLSPWPTRIP